MMHRYRTHRCGELRAGHADAAVRLSGFVHRKRDHGGLLFVDLRDDSGVTQCVVIPSSPHFALLERLRVESVICVTGTVARRTEDTVNPRMDTGAIEIAVEEVELLSEAEELPLPVFGEPDYPEEVRLRHRHLDLRRAGPHRAMHLRAAIVGSIRDRMRAAGFTEFQTPILTASSPEGARDFLVPSRLHPGRFYALPQAPQQFKQLLMIAGFDRYFQIAPCFRDEDARADRSPGEFYQLDIEMSFVTQDDVFAAIEPVMHGLFEEFAAGRAVAAAPFPRLTHADARLLYGSDKPDLRNPIRCCDVTDIFGRADMRLRVFADIAARGGCVRGIPAPGAASKPRSFFDRLNDWAREEMKAPGLGYLLFGSDGDGGLVASGPLAKFLEPAHVSALAGRAGASAGDALFFAAGTVAEAEALAAPARARIGDGLGLVEEDALRFCWIVDYPFYERDPGTGRIGFSHNPFSMPQGGMEALEAVRGDEDALRILAWQYDLVCNGVELSSGAIRNHRPDTMLKAFALAGYDAGEVKKRFGGLYAALCHGAPPHGGIAPGLDRIIMLLAGASNIRDIVCFPLNQQAQDLMTGAPTEVAPAQLRDLHIALRPRD